MATRPAKGPGGRPTKYRPEMCDEVIALGREGVGLMEMADHLDIHYSTFLAWQEEKPAFSEAVKEARRRSQAWWERMGRVATFGGVDGFNATSFIFNMKNRFPADWRDRSAVEVSGPDGGPVVTEIIRRIVDPAKDEDRD